MNGNFFGKEGQEFLTYLQEQFNVLKPLPAKSVFSTVEKCAILSVDVTNGFCKAGALASERVNTIIIPIVKLMTTAWNSGVHQIVLSQDTHEPNAVEFASWPAHCVRGSAEAETVDEIKNLPFYQSMTVLPKNSISSVLNTGLSDWLQTHPQLDTFLVVGDCTDLCVYQLAMHLRLDADAHQLKRRVIVPADCVQTYDFSTAAALKVGAKPHPGDVLHAFFLYHLALNGVEVVARVE